MRVIVVLVASSVLAFAATGCMTATPIMIPIMPLADSLDEALGPNSPTDYDWLTAGDTLRRRVAQVADSLNSRIALAKRSARTISAWQMVVTLASGVAISEVGGTVKAKKKVGWAGDVATGLLAVGLFYWARDDDDVTYVAIADSVVGTWDAAVKDTDAAKRSAYIAFAEGVRTLRRDYPDVPLQIPAVPPKDPQMPALRQWRPGLGVTLRGRTRARYSPSGWVSARRVVPVAPR